ncbi:P-loop NTPase fold protein [Aliarcobacter butzleri]|uniref:P-loop NTPase fold protein n=1 Tax=Aliarcobacter butzleri TaxID=28197 RepID=UPI00263EEBA4|nr:P-loop NTPase fold protein [Aliarcobacter butzleri]MDN5041894.1 P-loop NTPase fold protein [Aliarcobacter butzleri]
MQNKHISQFLNYYIELSNPQYAVFLKGKWGSGKTHFINEYKNELNKNKQKYIYVSLYGVTSYDEIETKFLEAIYPRLYNKKTIFAGKIAKQLLKATLKIDWDADGKADGNVNIQIPNFKPEDLLNTRDYILIFDDLERCSINIINLLGYINFFVEHQSYKVILIANEEELEKTEKYTQIKEKLIGKTFEFISDANSAYDSFLGELENENKIKENILEKEKENILELFEKSESNNLRALRQTLLDFERFYDEVLVNHQAKEELIKDILYWFFLFSFEIKQGNNDILNLQKLSEKYYSLSIVDKKNEEAEKTRYKYFFNKYNLYNNWDVIISFDLWKEILLNSYIKKEEIELALRNSKYYAIEEINSWKLLYNYYDLDDDIFEKLTNEIYFKIYNMEYKILKEVKMVSSILLSFKEKKLINKTDFCLEYEIIKQINYLFDNDLIDDESTLPNDMSSFYYNNNSFENYEFMKSSKMDEISKYIGDKLKIKLEEKLKKDSLLIINAIKENNIDDLTSWLVYTNTRYNPYSDKPILKYLNVNELLDVLKNTNNKIIRKFFHSLNKRYDFHIDKLIDEKVFLNELKTKLEILSHERNGKLSGYHFDYFSKCLIENIKKLNKIED